MLARCGKPFAKPCGLSWCKHVAGGNQVPKNRVNMPRADMLLWPARSPGTTFQECKLRNLAYELCEMSRLEVKGQIFPIFIRQRLHATSSKPSKLQQTLPFGVFGVPPTRQAFSRKVPDLGTTDSTAGVSESSRRSGTDQWILMTLIFLESGFQLSKSRCGTYLCGETEDFKIFVCPCHPAGAFL